MSGGKFHTIKIGNGKIISPSDNCNESADTVNLTGLHLDFFLFSENERVFPFDHIYTPATVTEHPLFFFFV